MEHTGNETPTDKVHAILIGVDEYTHFPEETLGGSTHNVIIFSTYLNEVLGVPWEDIHLLASPPPRSGDLPWLESRRALAATAGNVEHSLRKLLGSTRGEGSTVLFAFSGHGAWRAVTDDDPAGPVLCLSDTTRDFSAGVLPLHKLAAIVQEFNARSRLVAVLDCCHVAAPTRTDRLKGTSLPSSAAGVKTMKKEDFNVSDRVLLAAHPGTEAYQMRLGRNDHGALTFALVTVADRWHGTGVSDGSYKDIWKRTKELVKALGVRAPSGVRQKPQMIVPPAKWKAIRAEPLLGVKPGPTVKRPDADEQGEQLDPNMHGAVTYTPATSGGAASLADSPTSVGTIDTSLPANSPSSSPNPYGTEYWNLNLSALSGAQPGDQLTITPSTPAQLQAPSQFPGFCNPAYGYWVTTSAPSGNVWGGL